MDKDETKRKDPAMSGSGRPRIAEDCYETEEPVTEAICRALRDDPFYLPPSARVWEPACGPGKMARVLQKHFHEVVASDLHDYGWEHNRADFLAPPSAGLCFPEAHAIVTNPPYSQAQAFIERALQLADKKHDVVAMLLRNEYDSAVGRRSLFKEHPDFAMKLTLLWRPWWFEKKPADPGPRHNYAWFVWMKGWNRRRRPILAYAERPTDE